MLWLGRVSVVVVGSWQKIMIDSGKRVLLLRLLQLLMLQLLERPEVK